MTRKDFNLIAVTIRYAELSNDARSKLARDFADALASTNGNFDKGRFIRACNREEAA